MPKFSTNVRTGLLRGWFALAARLAPEATARWAFLRYGRTSARRRRVPPDTSGLTARALPLTDPALSSLRAWQWGTGPTVLLVHGWAGDAAQMTGFVAPLVAAGHRVVAFDQPAHGASAGTQTTLLGFRDAVLAVAAAAGPLAGVIAHSLGATATVLAFERGLGADRVALLAPPLEPGYFVDAFARAAGLPASIARAVRARVHEFLRADLGEEPDISRLAARQSIPALVLHDRDDRAVPFAHGQAIAAAWPGARLSAHAGLGHSKLLRAPAVIAEICAFVVPAAAVPAAARSAAADPAPLPAV